MPFSSTASYQGFSFTESYCVLFVQTTIIGKIIIKKAILVKQGDEQRIS